MVVTGQWWMVLKVLVTKQGKCLHGFMHMGVNVPAKHPFTDFLLKLYDASWTCLEIFVSVTLIFYICADLGYKMHLVSFPFKLLAYLYMLKHVLLNWACLGMGPTHVYMYIYTHTYVFSWIKSPCFLLLWTNVALEMILVLSWSVWVNMYVSTVFCLSFAYFGFALPNTWNPYIWLQNSQVLIKMWIKCI